MLFVMPWEGMCEETTSLFKAPEQLGQCGHARGFCPAPSQSAGAPCPAPARGSHLGRLPSAPQRESGSRLRACVHLSAFCAGAHDSMASTVGRVRVLAIETVSTERAPRSPSSICVRNRQDAAEHGVAVPRHTLFFNERTWAWAFAKCWLCARQTQLSARLLAHLQ